MGVTNTLPTDREDPFLCPQTVTGAALHRQLGNITVQVPEATVATPPHRPVLRHRHHNPVTSNGTFPTNTLILEGKIQKERREVRSNPNSVKK